MMSDKKHDFSVKYRVYYEDTDAGGVMYYANYLKFFERARTEFLRSKGIMQSDLMQKEQVVFVVKSCEIDYILPAKLDDLTEIQTTIDEVGGASVIMGQEMFCNQQLLAKLKVKIACVDAKNFQPKRLPIAF